MRDSARLERGLCVADVHTILSESQPATASRGHLKRPLPLRRIQFSAVFRWPGLSSLNTVAQGDAVRLILGKRAQI